MTKLIPVGGRRCYTRRRTDKSTLSCTTQIQIRILSVYTPTDRLCVNSHNYFIVLILDLSACVHLPIERLVVQVFAPRGITSTSNHICVRNKILLKTKLITSAFKCMFYSLMLASRQKPSATDLNCLGFSKRSWIKSLIGVVNPSSACFIRL